MSAMPGFAKNSGTTRRRIATVAATVLLAGSVQLLTAESSWACAESNGAEVPASSTAKAAPTADTDDRSNLGIGFFMSADLAIKAGGPKVEIGVEIGNHGGAPLRNVVPSLVLAAEYSGDDEGAVRYLSGKNLTVEYRSTGGWQKLSLKEGCQASLLAAPAKGVPIANDRVEHVTFRVGLSADAPAGLRTIHAGLSAVGEDGKRSKWSFRDMPVTVPKPSKPTPTKPAAPKPTPSRPTATAKPANPAGEKTAATPATPAAPAAPASTPTAAPATTAPAGTPELARTGAGTPNGLLAGIAAALAVLGAGTVVAVRRLRAQG
ncbi:hypothetical protein ABTX81_11265 [Kitasatospora sp. NPDC097605]|uniref:hypothetical protein n=1 Tax=Kitasatospora sp. NPDC097605 TaxID=3157226 RepID=UPI00333357DE